VTLLEEEKGETNVPLFARVAAARSSRQGEPWILNTSSHDLLLRMSASATTPGRHFAAGKVASFAEGGIGYRGWARRNGRLGEIHSLDNRYDHDGDELTA
jgi:hypothetical protein